MSRLNACADTIENNISVGSVSEVDVLELDLAVDGPVLERSLFLGFQLLLGDVLQVEHLLGLHHVSLQVIDAREEVHEPVHVVGPRVEEGQAQSLDSASVLGNDEDAENSEHVGDGVEASGVPVPAAVVGDEVDGSLVEEMMLLLENSILLAIGSDDRGASHGLMEV